MINQTELHRMRIDQGGTTAGYVHRANLNLQDSDLFEFKHQSGLNFIELNAKKKYDIELLTISEKYWTWWCIVWYIIDYKMVHEQVTKRDFFNAHTRVSNIRVMEAFHSQYEAFINSGIQKLEKGGAA